MKKIFLVGIVIALAITAIVVFKKEVELPPLQGTNVIAFGDSLVYGIGASEGKDFVSLLSQRSGVPIINAGVPGNTTEDALVRLAPEVLTQEPKVVILVIGGNDFLRRVPKVQTLTNLRSLITQIKSTGARVILVGISRLIYSGDYEDVAKEEGILFVPHVMDRLISDRSLMSDQIHPNDQGYEIFADAVEPYLSKALEQ